MPLECALYYSNGIVGANPKGGREDSSVVIEYNHEVYKPVDTQTGLVSGARVHGTVDLIAEVDSATVPLYQALCDNSPIDECRIEWFRVSGVEEEKYLTVTLSNVKVAAMEMILPNTKEAKKEKLKHLARLSLLYEEIAWVHEDGYEFSDGWAVVGAG